MNNPVILKIFCWIGLAYVVMGTIWIVNDYLTTQHFSIFRSILVLAIGFLSIVTLKWLKNNPG